MVTINTQIRKRAYLALFLAIIITSCNSTCVRQWELTTIDADCPATTYAKLSLQPCNYFNGLEAELLDCGGNVRLYLNARTLLFAASSDGTITLQLHFDDYDLEYQADVLEGCQRVLAPSEAQQTIISALLNNRAVDITIGRYQTTLTPDNFTCSYFQLATIKS